MLQGVKDFGVSITKVSQMAVFTSLFMLVILRLQKGLESLSLYLSSPIQNSAKVYWFPHEELLAQEATMVGGPFWPPWPWETLTPPSYSHPCDCWEQDARALDTERLLAQDHLAEWRIEETYTLLHWYMKEKFPERLPEALHQPPQIKGFFSAIRSPVIMQPAYLGWRLRLRTLTGLWDSWEARPPQPQGVWETVSVATLSTPWLSRYFWSLIVGVTTLRGKEEVTGQMEKILLEICMVESVFIKGHKV